MVELYVLLVAMLAAAIVAIETKELLAAIVAMGIVGFSVAIGFIMVQAPDLAIVQIVVEILAVVFFAAVVLRTTSKDTTVQIKVTPVMIFPTIVYGCFALLFAVLVVLAFRELPAFGSPMMRVAADYVAFGMEQTGAANLVTSVILDFRAYDTLGEAVVLFTAVVGVLTVVRQFGKKEQLDKAGKE